MGYITKLFISIPMGFILVSLSVNGYTKEMIEETIRGIVVVWVLMSMFVFGLLNLVSEMSNKANKHK